MRGALAVLVLALVATGVGYAAPPSPSLRLASREPLVVQGARFRAFEHVTVTVVALPRQVKRVTTSRAGSFRIAFDKVLVGGCGRFAVRAVGTRGSVALLKIPLPACIAA